MSSFELHLQPEFTGRNFVTGRFMKGHVPANKGKTWDEYMSKRSQRKARKGWKNLDTHRPTSRPDTAGRCRKPVIAVLDDGSFCYFGHIGDAALWIGGSRENVGRCCRENASKRKLLRPWGKTSGRNAPTNTDHRYKGVRWYFETDNEWMTKVKR